MRLKRQRKDLTHLACSEEQAGNPDAVDIQLIQRIRQGDLLAFAELVKFRQGYVLGIIRKHVPEEVVEDVAQVSYLEIYRSLESFRGESRFTSWMTRIVLRQCYAYWRKVKSEGYYTLSSLSESEHEWLDAVLVGHARERFTAGEHRRNCRELLQKSIYRLAPHEQFIITALSLEERSQEEVAEVLGWSTRRLRVSYHRAKKRLAVIIEELLDK